MKLYFYGCIMLIKKFVFRKNTGECILNFVEKMGVVYIKFAQMLAMQNIGNLFTEEDRVKLSKICDHIKPISFKKIKKQIEKEYHCSIERKFKKVFPEPVGSASISQVHKAILKNGDVVAIKIKRKDVTKRIERDVKQIRKFVHRYGRFVKLKNYLGSDTALNLYLEWIYEEVDFYKEKENIIQFTKFAHFINGKVENTKNIVIPKVYKKLCTENIIVMEFIFSKTINQMKLTNKNKEKISKSLNDYVSLTFYALLHNFPLVFHGDPHGGNLFIDKFGNIGFLDMGLVFSFSQEELIFIRKLFLDAYTCNIDELVALLVTDSKHIDVDYDAIKKDFEICCKQIKTIPVSSFFVNMMLIYTKYNIEPDVIFYKMAKTFVSLYGMNTFLENSKSTEQLLYKQIVEFYVNRSVDDVKNMTKMGFEFIPKFIKSTMEKGITKGIVDQIISLKKMNQTVSESLQHFDEVLSFFK